MRIRKLHRKATPPLATRTSRRHGRVILIGASTLALVLATTGMVTVLAGWSSHAQLPEPSVAVARASRKAKAPHATPPSPSGQVAPVPPTASEAPPTTSTTPPPVLTDGTYPTYLGEVDVDGATITVDVVQLFEGKPATKAAIEDGTPPSEARYLYLYIRNESPRLRTLPVAPDVSIQFADSCEAPPDRHEALVELARRTAPFDTNYYYDLTVADDAIHQITQHLATPAC